MVNKVI